MYVHPLYLEVNYYQQIWSRGWIVRSRTEVLLLSTIYFASNRDLKRHISCCSQAVWRSSFPTSAPFPVRVLWSLCLFYFLLVSTIREPGTGFAKVNGSE